MKMFLIVHPYPQKYTGCRISINKIYGTFVKTVSNKNLASL